MPDSSSVLACTCRTFERACRVGDAWGCTMQALQLGHGIDIGWDRDAALQALEGSCMHGEEDSASRSAMALRQALEADQD